MSSGILRLALAAPLRQLFDYLPPQGVTPESLAVGSRLRVPFGHGERVGILMAWENSSEVPRGKLRAVLEVLDAEPLLDDDHRQFLTWVAGYYQHPLGEVVCAALPVYLRKGNPLVEATERGWALTAAGRDIAPRTLTRAPRQAAVLQTLGLHADGMSVRALKDDAGDIGAVLKRLHDKGWVQQVAIAAAIEPLAARVSAPEPTPEQQAANEAIDEQQGAYAAVLLEGLTGSGKTEVYLRAAQKTLAAGDAVLVLVPEISLTPQLVSRFRERLGNKISLMHSGMNDRQRALAWQQARSGENRLIIGTRSAVFTPIPRLGLIVVDEEHDISFKQQEGFRYSARDLAVVRARRADCPVVLGSATPSLESLRNAREGRYLHLRMTQRPGAAVMPRIGLVDCSSVRPQAGLSATLLKEMHRVLDAGQQVLIFLNRRGYAPVLGCFSCDWLSDCPRCDSRQTLHAHKGILWCHHCGSQRRVPQRCPACGAADLHPLGQGTEQLEQVLQKLFPQQQLLRIDRDATRRKGSLEEKLDIAREGKAQILLGTQMLAKGHDFPGVALVGVLDVDGGLFGADFRAAERMAQLITQVAGRAGRGRHPGKVLIQSRHPDHPLLQTLVHQGYGAFAAQALLERKEAQLPPYSFQALLRAEANKAELPQQFLQQVAEITRQLNIEGISIWGPVPAPMQRRAGRYREHLLLQSGKRPVLQFFIQQLLEKISQLDMAKRVRWSLDVDPQDLH